jgi:hypothetical protein
LRNCRRNTIGIAGRGVCRRVTLNRPTVTLLGLSRAGFLKISISAFALITPVPYESGRSSFPSGLAAEIHRKPYRSAAVHRMRHAVCGIGIGRCLTTQGRVPPVLAALATAWFSPHIRGYLRLELRRGPVSFIGDAICSVQSTAGFETSSLPLRRYLGQGFQAFSVAGHTLAVLTAFRVRHWIGIRNSATNPATSCLQSFGDQAFHNHAAARHMVKDVTSLRRDGDDSLQFATAGTAPHTGGAAANPAPRLSGCGDCGDCGSAQHLMAFLGCPAPFYRKHAPAPSSGVRFATGLRHLPQ